MVGSRDGSGTRRRMSANASWTDSTSLIRSLSAVPKILGAVAAWVRRRDLSMHRWELASNLDFDRAAFHLLHDKTARGVSVNETKREYKTRQCIVIVTIPVRSIREQARTTQSRKSQR